MTSYTHRTGSFQNKNGLRIFHQSWTVEAPQGLVLIIHGLGEHSGRYTRLLEALAGRGLSLYGLDHQGHGQSEGTRGHVNRFIDYLDDIKQYRDNIVRPDALQRPLIFLGHSLGGLIATRYALTYPQDMDGLVLSSPGLIPWKGPNAIEKVAIRLLSPLLPRFTLNNHLNLADLSTDPDTVRAYREDPLVHDRISMRWATEFIDTAAACRRRLSELTMPLLLIHGDSDRMTHVQSSREVFEQARSTDKTLEIFEGLYHETMNETPEKRAKVLQLLAGWIIQHTGASAENR